MNRRQMLSASAVALLVAGNASLAAAVAHEPYTREAYEKALASGEPFLLDFYASW